MVTDDMYIAAAVSLCDNLPFPGCLKIGARRVQKYRNCTVTKEVVGYNGGNEVWADVKTVWTDNDPTIKRFIAYEDTWEYRKVLLANIENKNN